MAFFCFEGLDQMHLLVFDSSKNAGQGALWVKNLKSRNYPWSKKRISVHFRVSALSPLAAMLIAPSQCGPDETVVGFRLLYGGPVPLMGG